MLRLPQWVRDAWLPGAVAVVGALELTTVDASYRGIAVVLQSLACGFLVLRRRVPVLAASAAFVLVFVPPWLDPELNEPATPVVIIVIAVYALARYASPPRSLVGLAVLAVAFVGHYSYASEDAADPTDLVFVLALTSPPFVLGRLTRRLADQARQLEAQQEVMTRQAVRAERDRIARELHDVMAHSISAMVVQTAAAEDLVATDPEKAAVLLQNVARTGRRSLEETGRLLHAVRDAQGLEANPGLAGLDDLVAQSRASGLSVEADVDPDLPQLPADLDVSSYRILQELLTNALKYAPDAAVKLSIRADVRELTIATSNWLGNARSAGSGLGLVGMRERLHLLGGRIEHGATPDGRFVVTATIPLAGPA